MSFIIVRLLTGDARYSWGRFSLFCCFHIPLLAHTTLETFSHQWDSGNDLTSSPSRFITGSLLVIWVSAITLATKDKGCRWDLLQHKITRNWRQPCSTCLNSFLFEGLLYLEDRWMSSRYNCSSHQVYQLICSICSHSTACAGHNQ